MMTAAIVGVVFFLVWTGYLAYQAVGLVRAVRRKV